MNLHHGRRAASGEGFDAHMMHASRIGHMIQIDVLVFGMLPLTRY
jgi:hypothetical protein